MAPWLIFGAGGSGVGAKTLKLALAEHRPVIAVVRNPQVAAGLQEKGVQVFIGDACDSQVTACACRAAVQHATVISSMGGAQDYLAHRTVIDEAEKAEIKRIDSGYLSGLWRQLGSFLSPRARAAFGQAVREKSLAESLATNQSTGLRHSPPRRFAEW